MAGRKSFLLRIEPALWNELEGWAQEELRSVNGQIEYLLRLAVQRRKKSLDAASLAPPPNSNGTKAESGESNQS